MVKVVQAKVKDEEVLILINLQMVVLGVPRNEKEKAQFEKDLRVMG